MWIFRGLVFLVLLFVLVYFFVTNSGQVVDINFFGHQFLAVSIYWVVVVCFMVGFATSFILAALREFRFQRTISQLKNQVAEREREIHNLRVLPLKRNNAEADSGAEGKAEGLD